MAVIKKPKWQPPADLPEYSTCVIESVAFLLDKKPEQVWNDVAKQYWLKRGGIRNSSIYVLFERYGFKLRFRNDLNFVDYIDKKTGFKNKKQISLGKCLAILDKQPKEDMFILGTTNHAIGVKNGKVLDTGNTHDKSIVRDIYQILTFEQDAKAEELQQKKLRESYSQRLSG